MWLHVMLCYVVLVLCHDVLAHDVLCHTMLCYALLCQVMLCYVMPCYVSLCYVMLCYIDTTMNKHGHWKNIVGASRLCHVRSFYLHVFLEQQPHTSSGTIRLTKISIALRTSHALLCYVMLCYVMLCYAIVC